MNFKKTAKNLVSLSSRGIFLKRKKTLNLDNVRRVLIISLYFRGDFLFHTAVVKLLKDIIPLAEIDVWTKSRNIELAQNNPDISKLLIFDNIKTADYNDDSKLDLKGKLSFWKSVRKSQYDLIIDLTGKISTAIFSYLSGAGYTIGINNYGFGGAYNKFVDLRPASTKGHLIEKYTSVIKQGLNIPNKKWDEVTKDFKLKPYLYPSADEKSKINSILNDIGIDRGKPLILLHTTAGWKEKEWSPVNFSRLLELITAQNYEFIFIGDEKDRQNFEVIQRNAHFPDKDKYKNRFLKVKFLEVAELISQADILVGADSAPLHTAGAMETPSIGIFGPTNPDFSNPIGKSHRIVYHRLPCSASESMQYCTRNAGKTCPTVDCMKLVTPNEVMCIIQELINDPEKKEN